MGNARLSQLERRIPAAQPDKQLLSVARERLGASALARIRVLIATGRMPEPSSADIADAAYCAKWSVPSSPSAHEVLTQRLQVIADRMKSQGSS